MSTSGINYVYDLVDPEGKIKPFEYWTERGLDHIHYLKWRGIVSCLQLPIVIDRIDENNEMCEFRFVNSTDGLDLTNIYITQSFLYWQLIEHDHNVVIVPRIGKHCPEDIDWKSVYKRAYKILVQGVVFFIWIGMLIFGTNANINLLGLMIQKSFGAIFSVGVKVHFGVI